jgi:hypothetical protein
VGTGRSSRVFSSTGKYGYHKPLPIEALKLRALSPPDWLLHVDPDLEAMAEAQGYAFRAGPRPRVD